MSIDLELDTSALEVFILESRMISTVMKLCSVLCNKTNNDDNMSEYGGKKRLVFTSDDVFYYLENHGENMKYQ